MPVAGGTSDYDVVILGGGPAGCAAAIELARHGHRALVLERSLYDDARVGETIPPQAVQWLRELGIPDALTLVPHLPAPRVVRQWESPALLADALSFQDQGHGWHIDRNRFDALLAAVAEQVGATVRRGAIGLSCEYLSGGGWRMQFAERGRRIFVGASWVIDATGRRSWLLRSQGVRPCAMDRLVGLVGYGGPRTSSDPSLFVEATPAGWWYSAPLPHGRSVAAFMTDGDLIPRVRRDMQSFWEEQRASSDLISCLHGRATSIRTVVARTAWSRTVAEGHWLTAGDAAMAFDPLFGLGICRALASGRRCARAVLEAATRGHAATDEYQSWSESQYQDYLAQYRRIYRSVTRWPDSPFWRRRAA